MKIAFDQIRKIREITGAPVMRVKAVLEKEKGDEKKVIEILTKEGFENASKREGRETKQGFVAVYAHHSGKVAGVVELLCETDFVAKNELFRTTAYDIAMQVASMKAKNTEELNTQEFIKDPEKKIGDLVKTLISKTGENITIGRIFRLEIGQE